MRKVVYIIPGYGESTRNKRYKKLIHVFRSRGFEIIRINIKWKNRTMTDYVNQFLEKYKNNKNSYIFGFSFGAMIAFIASQKIMPKLQILCSLSPYFKEDLKETRKIFGKDLKRYFTEKQFEDLNKYAFNKIVKNVKCRTILIAGGREMIVHSKKYDHLIKRTKEAANKIKDSKLIIVENGGHDISQKEYLSAIKQIV